MSILFSLLHNLDENTLTAPCLCVCVHKFSTLLRKTTDYTVIMHQTSYQGIARIKSQVYASFPHFNKGHLLLEDQFQLDQSSSRKRHLNP